MINSQSGRSEQKGKNVDLRPITLDDTGLIVKWRNSPSVKKNFIFRDDLTVESHTAYFNKYVKTGMIEQFMIIEKSTEKPIGCVYLRDIDHENDKAEFGIFIGDTHCRGKGYGKESAAMICEYGFSQLRLHKIILRVFPYNVSALKTYESIGFKQEAYLKDELKIEGKYEDIIFMAKFAN